MANTTATVDYPPGYLEQYSGNNLVAVLVVFAVLDTIFVFLRFTARTLAHIPYGVEDVLVILGLVCALGFIAGSAIDLQYGGVGYHLAAVMQQDPGKVVIWAKCLIVTPVFYLNSVAFPKLSILAVFHRVFIQVWFRRLTYVLATVIALTQIVTTFVAIFQCQPVKKLWDPETPGGCINTNQFFIWASLPNILTDVIMLAAPLPIIWKLHNSTGTKIGISTTFLLGSIGLITSVVRFTGFFESDATSDGTWSSVKLLIWSTVEGSTYTIAASLICMRPLLAYLSRMKAAQSLRSRKSSSARQTPASPAGADGIHLDTVGPNRAVGRGARASLGWQKLNGAADVERLPASE